MKRANVTLRKIRDQNEIAQLGQRANAACQCVAAVGRFLNDRNRFSLVSSIVEAGSLAGSDVWPTIRWLLEESVGVEQVAASNPQGYVRASLWAGFVAGMWVGLEVTLPGAETGVGIAEARIRDLVEHRARAEQATATLRNQTSRKSDVVMNTAAGVMYALASRTFRSHGELLPKDRPTIKELVPDVIRTINKLHCDIELTPATIARHYLSDEWCKTAWTTICNAVRDGVPAGGLDL